MLIPPAGFEGWKVTTIGDDIAWIKPGADGRLYAINPEAGYFGVAPGTNRQDQLQLHGEPEARRDLHERRADRRRRRLVGRHDRHAAGATDRLARQALDAGDRKGNRCEGSAPERALHRSLRLNNPALDPQWDDPNGVAIDAFIFGGRRSTTVPLVTEARDWNEGVYMAATMGSETTAAAAGQQGVVRRDPFAMLPFTGYNMSDYFQHWLDMGAALQSAGRTAAEASIASTGSARAPTASSSGRAMARTCAC